VIDMKYENLSQKEQERVNEILDRLNALRSQGLTQEKKDLAAEYVRIMETPVEKWAQYVRDRHGRRERHNVQGT
jgi:hypothetical protein